MKFFKKKPTFDFENYVSHSVNCAYDKWLIEVESDGTVSIEYNDHPGYMGISLNNASVQELRQLSVLFSDAADHMEQNGE